MSTHKNQKYFKCENEIIIIMKITILTMTGKKHGIELIECRVAPTSESTIEKHQQQPSTYLKGKEPLENLNNWFRPLGDNPPP